MNFRTLYSELLRDAKNLYPSCFNIQDVDINELIDRHGFKVVDVFTCLDMIQWEREDVIRWHDEVEEVLIGYDFNMEDLKEDFMTDITSLVE